MKARRIDLAAVASEKRPNEGSAEIGLDAPGGDRQILMPIGDAQASAIYETGEPPVCCHQIGHGGIAMRDDEVFRGGARCQCLLKNADRSPSEPFVVHVLLVDQPGRDIRLGLSELRCEPLIERAGSYVERVELAQSIGSDLNDLVRSEVGRTGEVTPWNFGHQQPDASRLVNFGLNRRA